MNIDPSRVIGLALRSNPNGIKVMTRKGIMRPFVNSFIPYRKVLDGQLTEAADTELPFMIPVLDPKRCWHWNEVTVFSEYPEEHVQRWNVRLVIETDDHLFIYALKPESMTDFIGQAIEQNRAVGRHLSVGHEVEGNMSYTTLKTDKIKTRN